MFYIKKISLLTGANVISTLDLEPGLNIIYGESNTGKSLIVDCIDYIFAYFCNACTRKSGISSIAYYIFYVFATSHIRIHIAPISEATKLI